MLAQAIQDWYGERGAMLAQAAFDTIQRLERRDDIFNAKAVLQMAVAFERTVAPFSGTLKSVASRDKIALARQIRAEAEPDFCTNTAAGYGMTLFGLLLEAGETPGEQAAAAFEVLWEMLKAAVALKRVLDAAVSLA